MKRREFIVGLGGAAALRPLAARAQQLERIRRVAVLMLYAESDPLGQARATAFRQTIENLGWAVDRNLRIDIHWGVGDADWMRSAAIQMLNVAPDVVVANGSPAARAVRQVNRTVPIVFIGGADPVADGLVQSLAHPGNNMTGFVVLEPSVGAKLLELLKEIAPRVARVTVLVSLDSPSSSQLTASAAAAAQRFSVEVVAAPVRKPADIEAVITKLGGEPEYGLIVPPDPSINSHRRLIIDLAGRYRLPTVYALRSATTDGGLISYGVDIPNLFREAARYADRILRGEKAADLPVQQPTKFELVINLRTAKTLGLTVPVTLQAAADEVIE